MFDALTSRVFCCSRSQTKPFECAYVRLPISARLTETPLYHLKMELVFSCAGLISSEKVSWVIWLYNDPNIAGMFKGDHMPLFSGTDRRSQLRTEWSCVKGKLGLW